MIPLASYLLTKLCNYDILNLCDYDQAWFGRPLTTWSSDVAKTYGNQSYPVLVTDDQMLTMKNAAYNRATPLTMEQLLDAYAESPVESAMLILKKIVIGFDKKSNIAYTDPGPGIPWRDTPGILFRLWHYFVLFSALFAVTRKNTLTKAEKTLGIIIFVALVLPETFMKNEWRYIFAGYIALYYCFAFHFVGDAMEKADERRAILQESNYLAGLAIFSFLYLTCSFTLLA